MLALLGLHLAAAIAAPFLVRWLGRSAFWVLMLVPLSAVVWAFLHTSVAFGGAYVEEMEWVGSLHLVISFRVDVLSWLMILIVSGVGAVVMLYASRYFTSDAGGLGRFAGVFVGFAGAMLGVVSVDHTIMLYVFWEFTSVLSFLLIGHHHSRRPARGAARQALIVTSSGALAMFAGFVMLGQVQGGSYRISELIESFSSGQLDPGRPLVIVAALLVALGALTKSAQVPFHFWLPGAMAAPTPVSAYLHAAAMVKAGIYLVARIVPGFTLVPGWSAAIVTVGFATMVVGAYRALRQYDLKLVLAYGTVSQLGLMMAATGFGTQGALAAGLVLLLAHSLFKSALFLTVGAVESSTGTRDLRNLSGLWRRKPVLAVFAGLAALSMAGVPVTTGYLGKESFVSTLFAGSEALWVGRWADWFLLAVLAVCSMMTFAYAWRFWWGAFGDKRVKMQVAVKPTSWGMQLPILLLAFGALLGVFYVPIGKMAVFIAEGLPGHVHVSLWSGVGPAIVTAVIIGGGCVLAWLRPGVARFQRRVSMKASVVSVYAWTLRELELVSARVTSLLQRGSLPYYLAVIFITLIGVMAYPIFMMGMPSADIVWWDSLLQVGVVIVGVVAAIVTVRARKRMKAVLGLAAVGLAVTLLFATQGAPDLALTQLLVEAVSIVVFVLVVRKLPKYFSDRPVAVNRHWRLVVAVVVGLLVVVGGWYAMASRVHSPVSTLMPVEALEFGYGQNIVNVILVDIRAWDTVGELSVLLVTATGVASLIYVQSRTGRIDRPSTEQLKNAQMLPGAATLRLRDRSVVLEVATRALFPTMLMISVWLLLIGHNNPGGGFAGGVLAGLAFVLRYLAGGRFDLGEAAPIPAGQILGFGLFVAAAGGGAPLLFGNSVLESTPVDIHLGWLGDIHLTTAMILDVGVYILVVGLVIDLVSALGAEIDRQSEQARARLRTGKKVR